MSSNGTSLLLHLPLHHGPVRVALETVNDNLLDEHDDGRSLQLRSE